MNAFLGWTGGSDAGKTGNVYFFPAALVRSAIFAFMMRESFRLVSSDMGRVFLVSLGEALALRATNCLSMAAIAESSSALSRLSWARKPFTSCLGMISSLADGLYHARGSCLAPMRSKLDSMQPILAL
jgi:hypothetical protein